MSSFVYYYLLAGSSDSTTTCSQLSKYCSNLTARFHAKLSNQTPLLVYYRAREDHILNLWNVACMYSPLSREKSLLQCDKYIGTRIVISSELTLVTTTNSALQTNLESTIPCRNFLPICGQYAHHWLEVPTSSLIVGTQQHLPNHSSLKLQVPSLPQHKSCQNNQMPKRHHPQRDKRVNKIWGQILSFYLHSILHNPYHWQVFRQHSNQPLSFSLPSTPS